MVPDKVVLVKEWVLVDKVVKVVLVKAWVLVDREDRVVLVKVWVLVDRVALAWEALAEGAYPPRAR